jgi:peptidoglycan/LPS O-acetylase OafA/YrhL
MSVTEGFGRSYWGARATPGVTTSRIETIDALRGLAVLIVTLMHGREILWIGMRPYLHSHPFDVSPSSLLAYALAPLIYGAIGVSLLFVLSGYVIHRSVSGLLDTPGFRFATGAFFKRRLIRIYPTLVLAVIVTLMCDATTRTYVNHPQAGDTGLASLTWTLLALQGIAANPFGSNSPLWSLAVEIQFYAIYPLALILRRRIGMDAMLAVAVGVSVGGALMLGPRDILAFPQFYVAWWAGAYIADREKAGLALPRHWRLFSLASLAAGCASYTLHFCNLGIVLWGIGLAPILSYLIEREFFILTANEALKTLGRFSYTLYAVHFPILVLASAVFFGGVRQPGIELTLAITLATIVISFGLYLLAERPSLRRLAATRS